MMVEGPLGPTPEEEAPEEQAPEQETPEPEVAPEAEPEPTPTQKLTTAASELKAALAAVAVAAGQVEAADQTIRDTEAELATVRAGREAKHLEAQSSRTAAVTKIDEVIGFLTELKGTV